MERISVDQDFTVIYHCVMNCFMVMICTMVLMATSAWCASDVDADWSVSGTGLHAEQMENYRTKLLAIQHRWAQIKYKTSESERRPAFAALLETSQRLLRRYPDRAGAMAWSAVVLYNYAGEVGGIKALGMVKRAHRMLLKAERIDPTAAGGLIYTALGLLYYRVPGWPVAFGDDVRAENYLRKALALHPDSIDANYFMGDYLLRKKRYHQAARYLRRAMQSAPRKQFPIADAGRKADAEDLFREAEKHDK